ncbi:MAG TPA: hypothetical protein VD995_09455 [Azospirillum sp.]|nr:hypothetical protein [Azospirillum sp.]
MLRGVVRGAVMLVLLAAAPARAHTVDCWLLDADDLAKARARGECRDAFAVNPKAPAPKAPSAVKPPPPAKNVAPPKDRDRTRVATAKGGKRAATAKPRRGARAAGTDFASGFRRDLNAVGQLLGDLLAGRPPAKGARVKPAGRTPPAPHHR